MSANLVSRRNLMTALLLLVVLFAGILIFTNAGAKQDSDLAELSVVTPKGTIIYQVELAITATQRSRGLMYRRTMPQDYGMLFDFDISRPVLMWMKNTIISLDMIFIDESRKIAHIVRKTTPYSEATISSQGPVRYVLELNSGEADRVGMTVGQQLSFPDF